MNASVRDLKSRLSRYLRQVQRGETVVVTSRGKPIGPFRWNSGWQLQTLLRRAGALSEQLGVRAYDSIHLAGAEYLQASLGVPITFGSFDRRQVDAAAQLGMLTAPVDSQTSISPPTKGRFP